MTSDPRDLSALGELASVAGPDGSTASVALHGGHVVSWRTAAGVERLFLSDRATTAGGAAIRGGIPVCFPQFAGLGPLPKHGFARTARWSQLGASTFALDVAADAWPGWPHRAALILDVLLGPGTLTTLLRVFNHGEVALSFTGALHTYLACRDVTAVTVHGLEGREIHPGGHVDGAIGFGDGSADVDLAVLAAAGPVRVDGLGLDPGRPLSCAQTGFPDVVVWNVGARLGAAMGDLGKGQWRDYVCVEAAVVADPIVVAPGSSWTGSQTLSVGA